MTGDARLGAAKRNHPASLPGLEEMSTRPRVAEFRSRRISEEVRGCSLRRQRSCLASHGEGLPWPDNRMTLLLYCPPLRARLRFPNPRTLTVGSSETGNWNACDTEGSIFPPRR